MVWSLDSVIVVPMEVSDGVEMMVTARVLEAVVTSNHYGTDDDEMVATVIEVMV